MAVLGPEREWALPAEQPAPRAPAPQPKRKGKDPRRILAEQQANRQREFDDLQAQMVYSPALGRPAEGMIPAARLAQAGFNISPTRHGMAYGIDAARLNPEQQALMDALLRGGR